MTTIDAPTAAITPQRLLSGLIGGALVSRAIYVICKIGVIDALTAGPATPQQLGSSCSADAAAVARCLRLVAANGVLHEDDEGRFSLTEVGTLLREDVPATLAHLAVLLPELLEATPAGALYATRTGTSAFAHTHGHTLYERLATDPDMEALFALAMSARSSLLHEQVIGAIDWTGVRHIVDVGGNHGALLAAILRCLPEATGILFDQPQVVADVGPTLDEAGVADRVDVEAGDFFTAVPTGGDLYLVANVLWNWPEADALRILERCRHAMAPTARLVICEPVVPPGNDPHPAKVLDLANFWLNGGCTRTAAEWHDILDGAGFCLTGITEIELEWSVVEARRTTIEWSRGMP